MPITATQHPEGGAEKAIRLCGGWPTLDTTEDWANIACFKYRNAKSRNEHFYWQALKERGNDWGSENHSKWREPKPSSDLGNQGLGNWRDPAQRREEPRWLQNAGPKGLSLLGREALPSSPFKSQGHLSFPRLALWVGLQANLHHEVCGTQCYHSLPAARIPSLKLM